MISSALLPGVAPRSTAGAVAYAPIQIDIRTWHGLPRDALTAWHAAQGVPWAHAYRLTIDPGTMTATVYRYWTRGGGGAWSGTYWNGVQLDSGFWLIGNYRPAWMIDHGYHQEPVKAQPETHRLTAIPPFLRALAGRVPDRWTPPGPRVRVSGALAALVDAHLRRQTDRMIVEGLRDRG